MARQPERFLLRKKDRPAIDWSALNGLRNRIVHEYFGLSLPIIWAIVLQDLPVLDAQLRDWMKEMNEPLKTSHLGRCRPLASQQLEMERGVLGVRLQQPEVLVGKITNISRQGPVAAPEPARCRVLHRERWDGCGSRSSASVSRASSLPAVTSASSWRSQAAASNSANQRLNSANAVQRQPQTTPPPITVVGIDVGGARKGFHAVALIGGAYAGQLATADVQELAHWCRSWWAPA